MDDRFQARQDDRFEAPARPPGAPPEVERSTQSDAAPGASARHWGRRFVLVETLLVVVMLLAADWWVALVLAASLAIAHWLLRDVPREG